MKPMSSDMTVRKLTAISQYYVVFMADWHIDWLIDVLIDWLVPSSMGSTRSSGGGRGGGKRPACWPRDRSGSTAASPTHMGGNAAVMGWPTSGPTSRPTTARSGTAKPTMRRGAQERTNQRTDQNRSRRLQQRRNRGAPGVEVGVKPSGHVCR